MNKPTKQYLIMLVIILGASALVLLATACTEDASKSDLAQPQQENGDVPNDIVTAGAPDSVHVFWNVDGHANFIRICADGLAFMSVSTAHQGNAMPAIQRLPEWDGMCQS